MVVFVGPFPVAEANEE